ncbi:hypothetical protein RN001_005641 [Aquatica leii]|uniref:Uncharacterized protein n=1 Tax=Aquatica leii TaxID=1421715 RepID=A0AAN7Q1J8_9COLE|nr:hypothetical protein RN001_005641 [Aquatica leii]
MLYFRAEKKAIGPSRGARSSWKYFESINKIVGSLLCNDLSLIEESMSPPQGLELSNYYSEEQFEIINEDVESESEATSDAPGSLLLASDTSMPSTSSMTSSSSVKRKLLKRKATTRLDDNCYKK